MIKKIHKPMASILEQRLNFLQEKVKTAKTDIEKQIYSEAIIYCKEDMERIKKDSRIKKLKGIIILVFFIVIIILSWKILHKPSNSSIDETGYIGSIVHD